MTKAEFLAAVEGCLRGLSQSDIQKSLEYYSEMIDDRMEEGMSEADAVAAMGPIPEIVNQILMDLPLPKLVRARTRPSRTVRMWEILLLVLGSPVWLPSISTFPSYLQRNPRVSIWTGKCMWRRSNPLRTSAKIMLS